jgi:hypothetical protein
MRLMKVAPSGYAVSLCIRERMEEAFGRIIYRRSRQNKISKTRTRQPGLTMALNERATSLPTGK